MKISIFRKEGVYSLLLIVLCLFVFMKDYLDGDWYIIIVSLVGFILPIITIFGCHERIIFGETNITVIVNFLDKFAIGNKRVFDYSEFSRLYFATIKSNNRHYKWIILCRNGQEHNRINLRELNHPTKSTGFIAFKYSQKHHSIVMEAFRDYSNLVIEHIEVDDSTGQRTVLFSSKMP